MPKVGKKHFPYSEKGMMAAKAMSKKMGKKMVMKKTMKKKMK